VSRLPAPVGANLDMNCPVCDEPTVTSHGSDLRAQANYRLSCIVSSSRLLHEVILIKHPADMPTWNEVPRGSDPRQESVVLSAWQNWRRRTEGYKLLGISRSCQVWVRINSSLQSPVLPKSKYVPQHQHAPTPVLTLEVATPPEEPQPYPQCASNPSFLLPSPGSCLRLRPIIWKPPGCATPISS
jgi:hypothetical protein